MAYAILYGTNDQAPVTADDSRWVVINRTTWGTTTNNNPTTAFDSINNNYPQEQRVIAGGPGVTVPGQRSDTQKGTVFVNFPQGVWRLDENRVQKRAAIDYNVFYRDALLPGSAWIQVAGTTNDYTSSTHYYYNIRETMLRQATEIEYPYASRWDILVVKNGAGAVHNPLDHFEHEADTWGDQLWLESVQETSYTTLAYPNFIQVCLRFMASDSLAGADVNLSALIEYGLRSTLPEELVALGEDSPSAVAYDIMSDEVVGAAMPDSRIDLDFLARAAAVNDALVDDGDGGTQKLAVFNGVFDQDGVSIWDALATVGVMGRMNFQRVGTLVTGWLDVDDDPVQMFNVGNISQDSYSKTYLNLEDRAQELAVTFADAADNYKTRNPLRLIAAGDETSTQALKKASVNLLGCTNRAQAYYWATLRLRELETLLRTHTWKSNSQAIRCRTGNIVKLQHDVPEWGYGGLLQPGTTASSLVLEANDYPDPTGGGCTVIVQHPGLQRATISITGVTGNVLTVTGYDGAAPVKRLLQGGIDVAVTAVTPTTLKAESSAGLANGPAALWDLDVMETRTVTALTEACVATLSSPLSAVPADHAAYIYQSASKQAILVRIKQMRKNPGDQSYTFTAVDYDPSVYDIPAPVGLGG